VPVRQSGSTGPAAGGLHPSDSRQRVSRQDWLSPPASPNPEHTPFFDESEAKRLHMVRLSLLLRVIYSLSLWEDLSRLIAIDYHLHMW